MITYAVFGHYNDETVRSIFLGTHGLVNDLFVFGFMFYVFAGMEKKARLNRITARD
jgi:hypothetical protein